MIVLLSEKSMEIPVIFLNVVEDNLQDDKPKFKSDPHSDKSIHSYGSDVQNPKKKMKD